MSELQNLEFEVHQKHNDFLIGNQTNHLKVLIEGVFEQIFMIAPR
jgi:hypothetical protein